MADDLDVDCITTVTVFTSVTGLKITPAKKRMSSIKNIVPMTVIINFFEEGRLVSSDRFILKEDKSEFLVVIFFYINGDNKGINIE